MIDNGIYTEQMWYGNEITIEKIWTDGCHSIIAYSGENQLLYYVNMVGFEHRYNKVFYIV